MAIVAGVYLSGIGRNNTTVTSTVTSVSTPGVLQVVAAENFWGSLASQLGGSHANVITIVSDPNADPHDYEATPQDATAVADAQVIIENGVGYDSWIDKLISADNNPNQTVLNVGNLLGATQSDIGVSAQTKFSNEHFWYNPTFVNMTVRGMYNDYVKADPADTSYFTNQYASLNSSLHAYMAIEENIKAHFAGTKVAATETIFLYMANATGLDVVTPFGFMKAVADGDDPSAQDVATFQTQLNTAGLVKAVVYNNQTVTQVTDSMKSLATQNHIPVTWVTETMVPVNGNFEAWMTTELTGLQNALESSATG